MDCYMRDGCTRMICPGCSIYNDILKEEKERQETKAYLAQMEINNIMGVIKNPRYWTNRV